MYNINEEQTALKVLATDTYDNFNRINSVDKTIVDHLNLKVRMAPTHFCLQIKIGGPIRHIKDREVICLTNDQARDIYKRWKQKVPLT